MQSLKDYYRTTVDANDEMRAGWATLYYGVFSKVINDNNYKTVAEVGIGFGTHAKYVLKTTSVDKLYLVDPTRYYPNDGFVDNIMNCTPEVPDNNFNELYDLIKNELTPWEDRYTWFRIPSLEVTNDQIADGSLDCVFVDADNSYDAVKNDLPFWWKKIRVGGKMLGDDYWMDTVAKAVNEFAKDIDVTPEFLTVEGKTYQIYSFTKKEVAVPAPVEEVPVPVQEVPQEVPQEAQV
jgi:hypothetical protein